MAGAVGRPGDRIGIAGAGRCGRAGDSAGGAQALDLLAGHGKHSPRRLWDRATGKLDPEVAKSWEKYDIRLILERNWKTLGLKLAGKIHVHMGGDDTFYLEGATALLKEALGKLGSDAVVDVVAGKDHGTIVDKGLRERMNKEMAEAWRGNGGK
jgi:dienelactone hydrolase